VLLHTGQQFVQELRDHPQNFFSQEERIVDKLLFFLKRLPNIPAWNLCRKATRCSIFNAVATCQS
jgi:hypothetical protein